ncbi:hypothetical protein DSL64_15205 [Dyadobacter luteus]|uniref:Bacterial surface antigen (D15) domain-containing protein n=1 Tax=Dyadobacter luteus TaxID=2259619 RepID=A0A3D8YB01_9BACT|nr:BamA/TamA family outer membrane protein [Dyadobacter luteus]REA60456.1 hypothetical protein DSL64_15205 [Dyadobacter luteus]
MHRIVLFLLCGFTSIASVSAQIAGPETRVVLTDTTSDPAETDLIDIAKRILRKENKAESPPRKVNFSIVPAIGYTLSTGFVGLASANAAFHLSEEESTANLSSVSASFNYSQYGQLTIPVQTNIWTKGNRYNIVTDWRYFKYPQDTYGLGGNSVEENASKLIYSHIRLHQLVLKKISGSFYAGVGYMLDKRWKIKEEGFNADVAAYGLPHKSMSSGLLLSALFDNRKNSINPEGGFYGNIRYRINQKFLGSDSNWESLVMEFRKYINFPAGSKNTLALWNLNWLTLSGKPPYLDLPSTAWDVTNNTGRGYIQGRFRSPQMLYVESEYRFALTQNGLLGGVVFANAQSFSNWPSKRFSTIAPGAGVGLRLKVNKASRTNVGIDYGFGAKGSRGVFVNLGEIF